MEALTLHDAVVFLVAAGLIIPAAKQLKINPVLGFMLVGLFVGPFGIARFTEETSWLRYLAIVDVDGVTALAELGVIFLLFMIGLELSLERLWAMRRLVFAMGFSQILLTGVVIGAVAYLFGNTVSASIVLGSCLALSSTAVVIALLMEQGRFGSAVGQGSFSVLLAQDLAVVPILFVVGALGSLQEQSLLGALAGALAGAIVAIAAILGVGRLIVRPLFRFVTNTKNRELFVAITLLTIIATAGATHHAGLSAALGAFLAGLLLAETEFRYEIEVDIEPFKGLFIGLFFMSVAMGIDLSLVANHAVSVALSVAGLILIKAVIVIGLTRAFGYTFGQSIEIGLTLSQGGEFAFVVVGYALSEALLPPDTAQFMLIIVGATMFLTPLVSRLGQRIHQYVDERNELAGSDLNEIDPAFGPLNQYVVIVGFGRTGQLLSTLLNRQQIPYIALDLDARRVDAFQAQGVPVYRGDASRVELLKKLDVPMASAIAICTDDEGVTERVVESARQLSKSIPIVARARDEARARELLSVGATQVIPEVFESGLQFGHLLLQEIGVPSSASQDLVNALRGEVVEDLRTKK